MRSDTGCATVSTATTTSSCPPDPRPSVGAYLAQAHGLTVLLTRPYPHLARARSGTQIYPGFMPTGRRPSPPTAVLTRRRPISLSRGVDLSEPTAGLGTTGWLSLGPASELLGIDPDTLRRWADEGRVPAWTTPGGHRRFDADALNRLVAARRSTTRMPLTSLGASPERLTRVYQRHYASDERADE